jgi:methyl-accepting chemotaxis protein
MLNLRNLKIRSQLIILLTAMTVLFLIATGVSYQALNKAKAEFTRFIEQDQRVLLNYTELLANGLQMGQALRNIILDPANPKAYTNFGKASDDMDKLLGETRTLLVAGSEAALAFDKIVQLRDKQKGFQSEIRALVEQADLETAKTRLNKEETPVWRDIKQQLQDQIKVQKAHIDARETAVQENTENAQRLTLILTLVAVLVGLGIALAIVRNIIHQLNKLGQSIESLAAGESDLTVRLQVQGNNELCRISAAFNHFVEGMQSMVQGIKANADNLHDLARMLAQSSTRLRESTAEQTGAVTKTASAVEQMTASISSVADNAEQVQEVSARSADYSEQGLSRMQELGQAMTSVQVAVHGMADSVGKFLESTQSIVGATQHVKDIAEQINLLALNAAIEAARAGEQGRGFAVVADEVRKLAEKTAQYANEITRITADLNNQSGLVENAIQQGEAALNAGAQRSSEVSGIVEQAHAAVVDAQQRIGEITRSVREQSQSSNQISRNVERLADLASGNEHAIEHADSTVQQMSQLADQLHGTVSRFRS